MLRSDWSLTGLDFSEIYKFSYRSTRAKKDAQCSSSLVLRSTTTLLYSLSNGLFIIYSNNNHQPRT